MFNQENSMTVEEIKTTISQFLELLDKNELIHFNSKFWDEILMTNFQQRITSVAITHLKILMWYQNCPVDSKISKEEMAIFSYTFGINFLISCFELIKMIIVVLIDDQKIKLSEDTTYGTALRHICDELKIKGKKRKMLFDTFFVYFRNIFSHQKFQITSDGVFIKIDGKEIHLDFDQLTKLSNEVSAILDTIAEFANKKTAELKVVSKK